MGGLISRGLHSSLSTFLVSREFSRAKDFGVGYPHVDVYILGGPLPWGFTFLGVYNVSGHRVRIWIQNPGQKSHSGFMGVCIPGGSLVGCLEYLGFIFLRVYAVSGHRLRIWSFTHIGGSTFLGVYAGRIAMFICRAANINRSRIYYINLPLGCVF